MVDSDNEQVQRRTPDGPVVLQDLCDQLAREAEQAEDGRAALTLTPHEGGMKQTVVAVQRGNDLGPDRWNGPATLQVLRGRATVSGLAGTLGAGSWAMLPTSDAQVHADEDLVALLVVASTEGGAPNGS